MASLLGNPMGLAMSTAYASHSSHWGAFSAAWDGAQLRVRPHPHDPDPSALLGNFQQSFRHTARVAQPMIRKGWLQRGPGPDRRRGTDDFVAVSWDEALDRLAAELQRIKSESGLESIFGGSYGWSSAGRFHHAQSQVHRFLNIALGGYVRSVNTYSAGAAEVVLPHVLGNFEAVTRSNVTWDQVAASTEIVLAFGGMASKNTQVAAGGVSRHIEGDAMRAAARRGCRFVVISPQKGDLPIDIGPQWVPIRPGTDVALMLALCNEIVRSGKHDIASIRNYGDGWQPFEDYLLGRSDGVDKSVQWAATLCDIDAGCIRELAHAICGRRTLVVVAHALQRAEHGEQPVWMGAVLSVVLGQLGTEGGGYNYALGTMAHYGRRANAVPIASLDQGRNAVADFIPVARFSDMLLQPGATYAYNGQSRQYPRIKLAYWAGGNPFHHQQDLRRLQRAVSCLDTLVVHEVGWTATARHADFVLPSTMSLEREDIGGGSSDPLLVAMHRIAPAFAQSRDDYSIFCDLADRLGHLDTFSEGRDARSWLRHLYGTTAQALQAQGLDAPSFDEFWEQGELLLPQRPDDGGALRAFRKDPQASPLTTPSGKVQISSSVIGGFGYQDCPGYPAWLPPVDGPTGDYPLWLVSNQPASRLHSQLDFGAHSDAGKRDGREVCTLHPAAASLRNLHEGDIVRLFNERGACLASVHVSCDLRPDVVRLPTGAWYDPQIDEHGNVFCAHGNPNVLTRDAGTSSLAQGSTGQLTRIQVERFAGPLPPVRAFVPPRVLQPEAGLAQRTPQTQ